MTSCGTFKTMSGEQQDPFLMVTVLADASAGTAAITRSLGDAIERAYQAAEGHSIAGVDVSELSIAHKAFTHLRSTLEMPPTTVALYDVFPLAPSIGETTRKAAGQLLAAEALWTLQEQGLLGGVPPSEKLDLPAGWDKDPKSIRERLVKEGAHALSAESVAVFDQIKERWNALGTASP